MAEAVVVGVRVRPFNEREKHLQATLCIDMQGPATVITNAAGQPQTFHFDQSFWSHDDFEDDGTGNLVPASPGSRYSDQRFVFDVFGKRVLDNAWEGYHCCLFAYGQTGAGKSYSMVGFGNNKGIVPIACEEIFTRINSNSDPNKRYEVLISMVEIYNETVQDLFIPFDARTKHGYQIRESKALGIYVDGTIKHAVDSYKAIELAIEQGTSNRSVGSTAMNATSSRAHTVITIEFKQVDMNSGLESVKVSNINLVDLAGSEKAGQTGASGDRLKEGSAINKSLSALGNVIEKLAERSQKTGKGGKEILVPYRDSKLTRLLQNALGGSSKTIMICALSPASSNCEETLSTLRYADRAKKIKNAAVVNENPQEKLMREMREENAKLKAMLEAGGGVLLEGGGDSSGAPAVDHEALEAQKEQIRMLEQALQETTRSFTDRIVEAKQRERSFSHRKCSKAVGLGPPVMMNLNPELQLTGKLRFEFKENITTRIGGLPNADSDSDSEEEGNEQKKEGNNNSDSSGEDSDEEVAPQILLGSPGVHPKHAKVYNDHGRCFIACCNESSSEATWINGRGHPEWMEMRTSGEGPKLYEDDDPAGVILEHLDRLVVGRSIFIFVDPKEGIAEMIIMSGQITYAKARKELPLKWRIALTSNSNNLQQIIKNAITVVSTMDHEEASAAIARQPFDAVKSELPPVPKDDQQAQGKHQPGHMRSSLRASLARNNLSRSSFCFDDPTSFSSLGGYGDSLGEAATREDELAADLAVTARELDIMKAQRDRAFEQVAESNQEIAELRQSMRDMEKRFADFQLQTTRFPSDKAALVGVAGAVPGVVAHGGVEAQQLDGPEAAAGPEMVSSDSPDERARGPARSLARFSLDASARRSFLDASTRLSLDGSAKVPRSSLDGSVKLPLNLGLAAEPATVPSAAPSSGRSRSQPEKESSPSGEGSCKRRFDEAAALLDATFDEMLQALTTSGRGLQSAIKALDSASNVASSHCASKRPSVLMARPGEKELTCRRGSALGRPQAASAAQGR